jgi:hypothetical protein
MTTSSSSTIAGDADLVRRLRGNPWAVLAFVPAGFFMTLLTRSLPG